MAYLMPFQVGQRHGGFTGIIQKVCSMAQAHIWFERKVAEDRLMVSKRCGYTLNTLGINIYPKQIMNVSVVLQCFIFVCLFVCLL